MRVFNTAAMAGRLGAGLLLIAVALSVGACSMFGIGGPPDYRKSGSEPPLEVPPDLTVTESSGGQLVVPGEAVSARQTEQATVPEAAVVQAQPGVLRDFADVQLRREGGLRWLEVDAAPEFVWPKLEQYWRERRVTLTRTEPDIGIMETGWIERAESLPQGGIAVRDKYRLRLERNKAGNTGIFVRHRGARRTADENGAFWEPQPRDPEAEAELLSRMRAHLGSVPQATQASAAGGEQTDTAPPEPPALDTLEGVPVLVVNDAFDNTWKRASSALNEVGLVVRDKNRDKGVFYVNDIEAKRGLFSKAFGLNKGKGEYEIHLLGTGGRTVITAHNGNETAIEEEAANDILSRIQKALLTQG
ncbi:MAG: outer membrane protein assembly factor BamC [Gammaproteobacteria bacterium]